MSNQERRPAKTKADEAVHDRKLGVTEIGRNLSQSVSERASRFEGKEGNIEGVRFHRHTAHGKKYLQVWFTLTPQEEERFMGEVVFKNLHSFVGDKKIKDVGLHLVIEEDVQERSPYFLIGPRFTVGRSREHIGIDFLSTTYGLHVDGTNKKSPRLREIRSELHGIRLTKGVPSQEAFDIAEASAAVFQDILSQRIAL